MKIKTMMLALVVLSNGMVAIAQHNKQSRATNGVENGDFSAGNTGFNCELPYYAACGSGSFIVGASLTSKCDRWAPVDFNDHTTGTGNFLIIDGSTSSAAIIWSSATNIAPNKIYKFSLWARSLYTEAFKVEFIINGITIGATEDIAYGAWTKYTITWNSGSTSGSFPVALKQQTPGAYRDFGIDDISFEADGDVVTECINPVNLVANADFSAGDIGFNSDLPFNPACASRSYNVGTELTSKCDRWQPVNFNDHTTGTGNFLIVDGDEISPSNVWMQNVTVVANTAYTFSFWARSLYTEPFKVGFLVNGGTVAETSDILFGAWHKYTTTWNSGITSGSVTVVLREQTGGAYRDFGIDDIFFGTCGEIVTEECTTPKNLVANSSFTFGDIDFNSNLPSLASCLGGTYYVGEQLTSKCDIWQPVNFNDHTTGTGNFLIVDGDEVSPSNVWMQNVTVVANTAYTFSFWARSLYTEPFKVGFLVNGDTVAESSDILFGAWHKYTTTWNSGITSGSVTIALREQTGGLFRDFGIDDIFFGTCGEVIPECTNLKNLVPNATFTSGNTQFNSDLPFLAACAGGTYYVAEQLTGKCNRWEPVNFKDHTTGTGNFLIVDGDESNPSNVWMRNISIVPNTSYIFSFWARSLYTNPFNVAFIINGISISETSDILFGEWHKYTTTWNSGTTSGTVIIGLKQQTGGLYRDFGIDDIFFGTCGGGTSSTNTADDATLAELVEINLFPNPNNGVFTLATVSDNVKHIFIFDVMGKLVFEKANVKEKQATIDLSHLAKGIYSVKIISGGNCQVKKVIIE